MIGVELLGISLTGWVALVVACSAGIISATMWILGSERLHYIWGLFSFSVSFWAAGLFLSSQAVDPATALYWTRIQYIGVILIPFTYFHFVSEFTSRSNKWVLVCLYSLAAGFIALTLGTDLVVSNVTYIFNELYYNHPPGILHTPFLVIFLILVVVAHYFGFQAHQASREENFRKTARLFFLVTGISFIGATMNFLSVYGIFIHPTTNFTVAIAPPVIAYVMLKYSFFNIRVVSAQFLALFIVAFGVFRLAVSDSLQEGLFNLTLLLITAFAGVYLIRSVRTEVEQRLQIQLLANELKVKNEKLTELDKLKSQFLSIATHELRTPLTIVRNFVSLMLDGSYGKVPPAAAEAAHQVFERVTDMAHSVDSYLNVSRIEQGKISYSFEKADITPLVQLAVDGLKANAEKKGLALNLTVAPGAESLVGNIDAPKIAEVIINLIDNSIKYTPKGSVAVVLEKANGWARMTITDTGVGMSEKTQANLFKLFSPGEDSKKINPASTGVGLYVSKAHVEAHKGTLKAVSAGVGKGSVFTADIPLLK